MRPARCYRTVKRAYTRQSQKKPRKGYVKGVPGSKLHTFEMGVKDTKFTAIIRLLSDNHVQIRHNALEAARIASNKCLNDTVGPEGYFMKVLVYPHNVMRENALATGAGADRYQSGMRLAFGRPVGLAAVVQKDQPIFEVKTTANKYKEVKVALKMAASKLPTTCKIVMEQPA